MYHKAEACVPFTESHTHLPAQQQAARDRRHAHTDPSVRAATMVQTPRLFTHPALIESHVQPGTFGAMFGVSVRYTLPKASPTVRPADRLLSWSR